MENTIKKLLRIDKINGDTLKYYYTDSDVSCCDDIPEPMFTGIDRFDYTKPVELLAERYKDTEHNHYSELHSAIKKRTISTPMFINRDDDLDEVLLQYVRCFPGITLHLVWPKSRVTRIEETKYYEELNRLGKIHAIKKLILSKKQVQGVIHQMYYRNKYVNSMNDIINKQKALDAYEHKNAVYTVFFEPDDITKMSGKGSEHKELLREILRDGSGNQDTKTGSYLHITDNFAEMIELASVICNKNSLDVLHNQRLDRLLHSGFYPSYVILMTYKNWLYKNFSIVEQQRFLIFSSIILYVLGMRRANDIDLMIHHKPPPDKKYLDLILKYTINEETRFNHVDATMKGYGVWAEEGMEYKENWFNREWPTGYGSRSMDDTFTNPRFHFYYMGIKMLCIDGEMFRRIKRERPAAYADLYAVKKLTNIKIPTLKFSDGYWKSHQYYENTPKEKKLTIDKIVWYLRIRYHVKVTKEDVQQELFGGLII